MSCNCTVSGELDPITPPLPLKIRWKQGGVYWVQILEMWRKIASELKKAQKFFACGALYLHFTLVNSSKFLFFSRAAGENFGDFTLTKCGIPLPKMPFFLSAPQAREKSIKIWAKRSKYIQNPEIVVFLAQSCHILNMRGGLLGRGGFIGSNTPDSGKRDCSGAKKGL